MRRGTRPRCAKWLGLHLPQLATDTVSSYCAVQRCIAAAFARAPVV